TGEDLGRVHPENFGWLPTPDRRAVLVTGDGQFEEVTLDGTVVATVDFPPGVESCFPSRWNDAVTFTATCGVTYPPDPEWDVENVGYNVWLMSTDGSPAKQLTHTDSSRYWWWVGASDAFAVGDDVVHISQSEDGSGLMSGDGSGSGDVYLDTEVEMHFVSITGATSDRAIVHVLATEGPNILVAVDPRSQEATTLLRGVDGVHGI